MMLVMVSIVHLLIFMFYYSSYSFVHLSHVCAKMSSIKNCLKSVRKSIFFSLAISPQYFSATRCRHVAQQCPSFSLAANELLTGVLSKPGLVRTGLVFAFSTDDTTYQSGGVHFLSGHSAIVLSGCIRIRTLAFASCIRYKKSKINLALQM